MAIIILDYDGTLHDSMHIYEPAVRKCQSEMEQSGMLPKRELSTEEIRSYLGLSTKEMWIKFAPDLSENERDAGGKYIGQELRALVNAGEARLYSGARDTLARLRKDGHRLIFLSNCTESYMKLHRDTFNLADYFHEMYCSEMFSWKEKWEIARELLAKWGAEDKTQVIAVGDRYKDIDMAKAGNIRTIWCSYGFGAPSEGESANAVAADVKDIPEIIDSLITA